MTRNASSGNAEPKYNRISRIETKISKKQLKNYFGKSQRCLLLTVQNSCALNNTRMLQIKVNFRTDCNRISPTDRSYTEKPILHLLQSNTAEHILWT